MADIERYYATLMKTGLFDGVSQAEMLGVLKCLGASIRAFDKNVYIIHVDDDISEIGVVLDGKVQIAKDDEFGNKVITTEIAAGGLFAETFVCAGIEKSPVLVMAMGKSEIMFLDFRKIITVCSSACVFHMRLIENMLRIIANKNIMLHEKMDILTKKTTREKLIAFLKLQARKTGKSKIIIPFNRDGLADFLSVNRSSMSRELSKMRDEGLIRFHKNKFVVDGS